ncbi:hypothetical protein D3C72_1892580 [compost metagenome]
MRRAAPYGFAEVGHQLSAHIARAGKAAVVEAVEIELEGFALDDVGCFAGDGEIHQGHLWLAPQVEPRDLIRRPQVGAKKRQPVVLQSDLGTLGRARQRKEQGRVVLVDIGRALAQGRLLGLRRKSHAIK